MASMQPLKLDTMTKFGDKQDVRSLFAPTIIDSPSHTLT